MSRQRWSLILALVVALGAAIGNHSAQAQSLAPPYDSYAAKFACGTASTDADVVKGTYATSINIHNPQAQVTVQFYKKLVVANEEGQSFGQIVVLTKTALESLPPDLSERVDCPLIEKALGVTSKVHTEGFLVIQVPASVTGSPTPSLDVIGKYSVRSGATGFTVKEYQALHIVE